MEFKFRLSKDESTIREWAIRILALFNIDGPKKAVFSIDYQNILAMEDSPNTMKITVPFDISFHLIEVLEMEPNNALEQKRIFALFKKANDLLKEFEYPTGITCTTSIVWLGGFDNEEPTLIPYFVYKFEREGEKVSVEEITTEENIGILTEMLTEVNSLLRKI